MKTTNYKNFGKCVELSNANYKLLITADFGPRVIFFGRPGGENLFFEDVDNKINRLGWKIYGGHRLWLSPEIESTYDEDNAPPTFEEIACGLRITSPVDKATGIQKTIEITLGDKVKVCHIIKNCGDKPATHALWALTVLAPGGELEVPLNTADTGWLPNRNLVFWGYSDINDKRFTLNNNSIYIKQDKSATTAFKVGTQTALGLATYKNKQGAFKKTWSITNGDYPDMGCSFEGYTNNLMLESETLSPLYTLAKGETAPAHTEEWEIL